MESDKYWKTRRTVRRYSARPVDDEMLTSMLEQASHAPTTGNMQLYSAVITRDPDMKNRLAPAHFSQPAMTGAPVVITFCADFNRFVKWCGISNAVPGYNNFQSFMTAVIDTVILTQQFVTIAEMSGLGCCYLGTTTYNAPMIADILGLPSMVVPVASVSVGWPDGESPVSDRLPVESFVHHEMYKDPDDESVRRFYAYKESLPDSARFIAENGKETLAQVFTDVRYPKVNNEHFSGVYRDFIERAGFPFPD